MALLVVYTRNCCQKLVSFLNRSKNMKVFWGFQVEELRTWATSAIVQDKAATNKGDLEQKVLVLSGPAGCGKSAAVLAVAADLHVHVHQWTAPAAITWHESRHMGFQPASHEKGEKTLLQTPRRKHNGRQWCYAREFLSFFPPFFSGGRRKGKGRCCS